VERRRREALPKKREKKETDEFNEAVVQIEKGKSKESVQNRKTRGRENPCSREEGNKIRDLLEIGGARR